MIASSSMRRVFIGILPSALLIAAAFIIYAYQSHALSDYQTSRNFRALNMMGNQIKSTLNAEEDVVTRSTTSISETASSPSKITFISTPITSQSSKVTHGQRKWTEDLAKVVEPLMRLDVFDSVLVARQDGTVLVQDPNMLFRVVDLRALLAGKPESKSGEQPLTDTKNADIVPRSDTYTVRMGDDQYNVFVHPISLRQTEEGGKPVKLVLAGVIRQDEFKPANFIDTAYLEFGFVLCITLLVGWPLQRIIGLSPGQRFRRRDGLLFLASGLCLVSMISCLFLDVYYDSIWDRDLDQRLARTAVQINDNFVAELKADYNYLLSLDDRAKEDATKLNEGCLKVAESREPPPGYSRSDVLVTDPKHPLPTTESYPFQTTEWLNSYGIQRIKWSTASDVGSFGDRRDRAYFQNLKHGAKSTYEIEPGKQFSLQRLHSWETAQDLTVMGVPVDPPWSACIGTRVAGIRLQSVGSIVLPPNTEYVVVDGDGLVVYHANEARVQVENFVDECEDNKDAVATQVKKAAAKDCPGEECEPIEAKYQGKSRRMHVRPLDVNRLPWSVIVYSDLDELEHQKGRGLGETLIFFFIYLCSVSATLLVLYRTRRKWWAAPPWREVPARLACIFALLLILIIVFSWCLASARSAIVIGGAFLLPLVAIALTTATLTTKSPFPSWFKSSKTGETWPLRHFSQLGWPQFSAAVALVILVAILPCLSFWKVAYAHQREEAMREGQLELAKRLELRNVQLTKRYEKVRFAGIGKDGSEQEHEEARAAFLRSRDPLVTSNAYAPDLYYQAFFDSTVRPDNPDKPSDCKQSAGVLDSIDRRLRLMDTLFKKSDDARWCTDGKSLVLLKTDPERASIVSVLPAGELAADGWVLTKMSGLLVLFCAVMYFAVCRLLHLDRKSLQRPDTPGGEKRLAHNLLLTGAPGSGKSALLQKHTEFHIIDLHDHSPDSLANFAAQSPWAGTPPVFAIDHLDYEIDDPQWNGAILKLLERLVGKSSKSVILVSNVNPILYLRSANMPLWRPESTDPAFSHLYERWVDLLASFQIRSIDKNEDFSIRNDASAQTYQAVWRSCSWQERSVLLNLAQDGMVNPKNSDLLGELCRREILVMKPILRFRDRDFAPFIRRVYGPDQLATWELAMRGESGVSSWNLFLGICVLVGIGLSFKGYQGLGPIIASASGAINLLVTVKSQFAGQASKPASGGQTK